MSRFWLTSIGHATAGVVAAVATEIHNGWAITLVLTWTFLKYQRIEQKQENDKAYPEIAEYMIGLAGMTILMIIQGVR